MGLSGCSFKGEGARFCIRNELPKILSFRGNKFELLIKKVILQYNVYVILCFLHLLLKCCCVGVYRGFENLFKTFFYFELCELLVIVSSQRINFLSSFEYNALRDDSEEYCGFYHHSNVGA